MYFHWCVIYSPDTDVIVIATSFYYTLNVELYTLVLNSSSLKLLNVGSVASVLKESCSKALIGLHAFSGCDSTSSFFGKGKQKFLTTLMKSPSWQSFFSSLGTSWDAAASLQQQCEKVACELYGWRELSDINIVRYNCFKMKSCTMH